MPDYARVCRECGATLPDDWQRPDGTFECCFCGRVGEPAFKRAFTAPAGSWPAGSTTPALAITRAEHPAARLGPNPEPTSGA